MSLAADIFDSLYDYAEAVFSALGITVSLLKDQQAESPPAGRYVTIQGTSTLNKEGTAYRGPVGSDDTRQLVQLWTAEVVLWEVNGDGSALEALVTYADTEDGSSALLGMPVSILDMGDIVDASTKVDNNWISQARTVWTVSIASVVTETLPIATTVEIANVGNPNNKTSITVS